jgi:hypothetical protein
VLIDVRTRAAGFLKHLVERQFDHCLRLSLAAAAGTRSWRICHGISHKSVELLTGQAAVSVDR